MNSPSQPQLESNDPKYPSSFQCHELSSKILRNIQHLYKSREFYDVLLKGRDNIEIKVHRVILCSSSEWFQEKFKSMPDISKPMRIEVNDITSVILEHVLEFMYTSSVNLCIENAKEVLRAADNFQMELLMDICFSFLKQELNSGNCLSTAIFAKKHCYSKLAEEAFSFICTNFENIFSGNDFLQLDTEMLDNILCSDELSVLSEEIVVSSLLIWLEHDRTNRQTNWIHRLSNVRYQFLTQKFIIENTDFICINLDCHNLICHWLEWHLSPEKRSKLECASLKPRKRYQCAGLTFVSGYKTDNLKIQTYFPKFNYWTWKSIPLLGENLMYSSTIVKDDEVIIVGGVNTYGIRTNEIKYFNIKTNDSGFLPSMKTPRSSAGIAMFKGYLFVIGGRGLVKDRIQSITTVEAFNFITRKWIDVEPLKKPLFDPKTAVLNGSLYVIGSNSINRYNLQNNEWISIAIKMKLFEFSFAALGRHLFVVGGLLQNRLNCASIQRYDPENDIWDTITSLETLRQQSRCLAYKDSLVVIGGTYCFKWLNTVQEYNIKTKTWKNLAPLLHTHLDTISLYR